MGACISVGFDPYRVEGQPTTDLFKEYRGKGPQQRCLCSDIVIPDKSGSDRGMCGSRAKAFVDLHSLLKCGAVQRLSWPNVDIEWPDPFPNDKDFVEFVKRKAVEIYGLYLDKEEEAKITSLGSRKRINRVFDLMGIKYDD